MTNYRMDERPGRKTNKLGSMNDLSGPFGYWSILLMTIADGFSRPEGAESEIWP
jgi:hypothetical protein